MIWNIVCYFLLSAWSNVTSVIAQQMEGFRQTLAVSVTHTQTCMRAHGQAQAKQMQDFVVRPIFGRYEYDIFIQAILWYVSGNNQCNLLPEITIAALSIVLMSSFIIIVHCSEFKKHYLKENIENGDLCSLTTSSLDMGASLSSLVALYSRNTYAGVWWKSQEMERKDLNWRL